MQPLRYLAYDCKMRPFKKDGCLVPPKFEDGRILVREFENKSFIHLMERKTDEEAEAALIAYLESINKLSIITVGGMSLSLPKENGEHKSSTFEIAVRNGEKRKGYGTAIMSGGANYGRDIGLTHINGKMVFDKDILGRTKFFDGLNMWHDKNEYFIFASVNEPKLNQFVFERNPLAEEILNSRT